MRYNSSMLQVFELLPMWYQYSVLFLFGLIIGSFLNVVIYRYHTGKSLNGHSHCLSCGHTLRWFELFPLVSYLCLFGRCHSCGSRIPARYFVVELTTAILFVLLFTQLSIGLVLLFSLVLISVLMIVAVYDYYHMIIPDTLVISMGVLSIVYYLLMYGMKWDTSVFLSHFGAAVGAFLFYGGLWFVSKGRWIGFGDAKLAIPLGFILGTPAVFSFVVLSFWVGAFISVGLIVLPALFHIVRSHCSSQPVVNYSKYFTMKSEVPFAPFMIVAFLLVYMYQFDVLELMATFI